MIWNTIAHPKMMVASGGGAGGSTSLVDAIPEKRPIKFANTHKLSFYDVIISMVSKDDGRGIILVKGDFETLKHMILNDEAVCGAMFAVIRDGIGEIEQGRTDFVAVKYIANVNAIAFTIRDVDNNMVVYLHSDNTITDSLTSESGGSGLPDGTKIDDGSGQSEVEHHNP